MLKTGGNLPQPREFAAIIFHRPAFRGGKQGYFSKKYFLGGCCNNAGGVVASETSICGARHRKLTFQRLGAELWLFRSARGADALHADCSGNIFVKKLSRGCRSVVTPSDISLTEGDSGSAEPSASQPVGLTHCVCCRGLRAGASWWSAPPLEPPPSRTSSHFIHLFSKLAVIISLLLPSGCAPLLSKQGFDPPLRHDMTLLPHVVRLRPDNFGGG